MVPGQFIIKFKPDTRMNIQHQVVQAEAGRILDWNDALGAVAVEFPALKEQADVFAMEAHLTALRRNPHIEYVEPNYIYHGCYTPNDPWISSQWGLAKVGAYEAWDITLGAGPFNPIKIAIVDSGIKLDHEEWAGILIYRKITDPYDFVEDDNRPDDLYGHGTKVAGIAAARIDNQRGAAGLCPRSSIMPVKVMATRKSGYAYTLGKGITYAADKGAHVINLSLGGYAYSQYVEQAVAYAWGKGAVLVGAAGNGGTSNPYYPAAYQHCMAVAATDENDNRWSESNYGNWVSVAAPGVNIFTTATVEGFGSGRGFYTRDRGTSLAAPHVAGLAGLIRSYFPRYTNSQVLRQIATLADRINGTGTYWQNGRINAARSLKVGIHNPPGATGGNRKGRAWYYRWRRNK